MNSIWAGHKYGEWYPWPQQIPAEGWYIVAIARGRTVPAYFTPNKAGNGGKWKNGYKHRLSSALIAYWMPLPSAPAQHQAGNYHEAWDAAGDKATMRALGDIRAYLSDGLWMWPCGATVDDKLKPLKDFHDTSKCNVCTKAINEVIGE